MNLAADVHPLTAELADLDTDVGTIDGLGVAFLEHGDEVFDATSAGVDLASQRQHDLAVRQDEDFLAQLRGIGQFDRESIAGEEAVLPVVRRRGGWREPARWRADDRAAGGQAGEQQQEPASQLAAHGATVNW